MIQKRFKKFIPVCDHCGNELEPADSYQDAKEDMYIARWKSVRLENGEWEQWCDVCLYENRPTKKDNEIDENSY